MIGDIADIVYPSESLDYIRFWHSLERCRDPVTMQHRARSWLEDTGTLGVAALNANSTGRIVFGDHWFNLDVPGHLFAFSRTSITQLLSDSVLLVIEFETYSPRSDWTNNLRLGGSDRNSLVASALTIFPMPEILGLVQRLADLAARGEHLRVSARPTGEPLASPPAARVISTLFAS